MTPATRPRRRGGPESGSSGIPTELRHRKVWQVAVAYAGAGFVVWQVADLAFPHLGLPDGVLTAVIWATLAGFPVAVVMAWMYDSWRSGSAVEAHDRDDVAAPPADVEPTSDTRSLVVLPFEDLSPDPEDAFFADGLITPLSAFTHSGAVSGDLDGRIPVPTEPRPACGRRTSRTRARSTRPSHRRKDSTTIAV